MSSARNVHFERSRALGSLNARPLGAMGGMGAGQSILLGLGLIYAGIGFPGLSEAAKATKNVLKYKKRETVETLSILGGALYVMSGLAGAYRS